VGQLPGHAPDHANDGDVAEFGRRRRSARSPWGRRTLLAGLVVAAAVAIAINAAGQRARPQRMPAAVPPIRVIAVGHPLLGVTGSWELFARGPDYLLRIELARGRIVRTYVPSLETASPDVALVVGAHEAVIHPSDLVPGYVIPDNGQARPLTGLFANGGPMVPGPPGTQAAWVISGQPTSPVLALVTLTGRPAGPSISFPPDGPQMPGTAVTDGQGDVLVTSASFTVTDLGPSWNRPVPGTILAVGPTGWLMEICNAQYRDCRYVVVSHSARSHRILRGRPAQAPPYYLSWPPSGVISPGGSTAAVTEPSNSGQLTVGLVDLRTGASKNLHVPLETSGAFPSEGAASEQSMAWSPDGRWLFVTAPGGRLIAINASTDRAEGLGVRLPAVDQLAIRS
jgi:hypothetical protein